MDQGDLLTQYFSVHQQSASQRRGPSGPKYAAHYLISERTTAPKWELAACSEDPWSERSGWGQMGVGGILWEDLGLERLVLVLESINQSNYFASSQANKGSHVAILWKIRDRIGCFYCWWTCHSTAAAPMLGDWEERGAEGGNASGKWPESFCYI